MNELDIHEIIPKLPVSDYPHLAKVYNKKLVKFYLLVDDFLLLSLSKMQFLSFVQTKPPDLQMHNPLLPQLVYAHNSSFLLLKGKPSDLLNSHKEFNIYFQLRIFYL
jgi:hypothetical protein